MGNSTTKESFFTNNMMTWASENDREMPWRGEKDPYKIWLSEVILQQTRVAQGLSYYEKFVKTFPRVHDLAAATEDEVFKLWQGLGYYSRARNLHTSAKYISEDLKGVFPRSFDEIIKLKGVGPYTAAAIASFAYGLQHAVVDGNVYRLLARYFGISTPIDSNEAKKRFHELANELLYKPDPGAWNQAMMDFGSTVCTPQKAGCTACPLAGRCTALEQGLVSSLPVKTPKMPKKERFFHYFVLKKDKKIMLRKRTGKDIWKGLYDFPLLEVEKKMTEKELKASPEWKAFFALFEGSSLESKGPFKQILSHQVIKAIFWEIEVVDTFPPINDSIITTKFENFAYPRVLLSYFDEKKN